MRGAAVVRGINRGVNLATHTIPWLVVGVAVVTQDAFMLGFGGILVLARVIEDCTERITTRLDAHLDRTRGALIRLAADDVAALNKARRAWIERYDSGSR